MRILLIEDNPGDARLVQEVLREAGSHFEIRVVERLGLGLDFLASHEVDVVLLDLGLPDSRGLGTLTKLQTQFPHLPIVIMTGSDDETLGVQAVHFGAQDYLVKGQVDSRVLRRALQYAIERKKADEALHREKTISDTTIESLPGVFYLFDSRGQFLRWNKNFERVTGYTADELSKMQPQDFFAGEDKRLIKERVQEVFAKGESTAEAEFVSKDGHKTPYFFTGLMTNIGNTKCLIGMGIDITERRRFEDALRQRTAELQQLTDTLEHRVQERTQDLEVLNEELKMEIDQCQRIETDLRKSQSDLRQLSMALLNAQEKERKLIAQEIHDSLGASLAATKFKLETALKEISGDNQAGDVLKGIVPIVQGTIEEARRIQMSLRPSILDDLGILATINWFCRQFESTYSNIRIRKEIEIEEDEVPESLKIVIYRVLQEALNNVAKYSKASAVLLVLRKAGKAMELVIRDSGKGFDLSEARSRIGTSRGLGLDSMRERTELSGGSFNLESTIGKGTIIQASWRVKEEQKHSSM
ncbi:MAG: response regulator [Thermodesulfobacteriota bacterium]